VEADARPSKGVVGTLQEKYSWAKERAEQEIARRVGE
jgi:uncharacterized protein YjbJ (UPF0337 family)